MHIRRTRPDPTRDYDKERRENGGRLKYPPSYVNAETHWWDASQIYGSNAQTIEKLRSRYERDKDGKFRPTGEILPVGKVFLDHNNLRTDPSDWNEALTG